jgi:hypothetical protein
LHDGKNSLLPGRYYLANRNARYCMHFKVVYFYRHGKFNFAERNACQLVKRRLFFVYLAGKYSLPCKK